MIPDKRGMHCPSCGARMTRTTETRPVVNGVRRRRECVKCGEQFTTIEKAMEVGRDD